MTRQRRTPIACPQCGQPMAKVLDTRAGQGTVRRRRPARRTGGRGRGAAGCGRGVVASCTPGCDDQSAIDREYVAIQRLRALVGEPHNAAALATQPAAPADLDRTPPDPYGFTAREDARDAGRTHHVGDECPGGHR